MLNKKCPHCAVLVPLKEGHMSLKCPSCGGFIVEVYGDPKVIKKALKKHKRD